VLVFATRFASHGGRDFASHLSFSFLTEDSDADRHDDGQAYQLTPSPSIDAAAVRTSPQPTGDELTLVSYPMKFTGAHCSHIIQRHYTANGQGYLNIINTTSLKTARESTATPTSHVKCYWIGA
jgi:hypothetical protein